MIRCPPFCLFFFFNDPPPPEIYPLPLHAPLPISPHDSRNDRVSDMRALGVEPLDQHPPDPVRAVPLIERDARPARRAAPDTERRAGRASRSDRKSTRLNSSHLVISYAVFCLKKKQ